MKCAPYYWELDSKSSTPVSTLELLAGRTEHSLRAEAPNKNLHSLLPMIAGPRMYGMTKVSTGYNSGPSEVLP